MIYSFNAFNKIERAPPFVANWFSVPSKPSAIFPPSTYVTSFFCLFVRYFVHLFVHLFLFVRSSVRSFVCLFVCSLFCLPGHGSTLVVCQRTLCRHRKRGKKRQRQKSQDRRDKRGLDPLLAKICRACKPLGLPETQSPSWPVSTSSLKPKGFPGGWQIRQ